MLPPANRLRRSADFDAAVRSGSRARGGTLVVHHLARPDDGDASDDASGGAASPAPQVGLIVSKQVGGSVVRHRVSRRLRAQLAGRLSGLPAGSATVVRALPPAADAPSARLGADLDRALSGALSRRPAPRSRERGSS